MRELEAHHTGDAAAPSPAGGPGHPEGPTRAEGQPGRSDLQELAAMLPDVARLLPALVTDPRVPRRTKFVAAAALAYVTVPIEPLPELVPGTRLGVDDLLAIAIAVRHLVTGAGYEVVRERWTGTDAGFAYLLLFTGVEG